MEIDAEGYFTKVFEEYVKQLVDESNEIGSKIISNSIQI